MDYRRRDKHVLRGHSVQPHGWKFLYGILITLGLVLALIVPLFIFSTANPLWDANPVEAASVDFFIIRGFFHHPKIFG